MKFLLLLFFVSSIIGAGVEESKFDTEDGTERGTRTISPPQQACENSTLPKIIVLNIPIERRVPWREKFCCCTPRVVPERYPIEHHIFTQDGFYYGERTIWNTDHVVGSYYENLEGLKQFYENPEGSEELGGFYHGTKTRTRQMTETILNSPFILIEETWPPVSQEQMSILFDTREFTWERDQAFKMYLRENYRKTVSSKSIQLGGSDYQKKSMQ